MREICSVYETDFHNFPENETMHTNKSRCWEVLPSPGLDTGVPTKEMDITRPSEDKNLRDVVSILISPICDFDSEAGVE